ATHHAHAAHAVAATHHAHAAHAHAATHAHHAILGVREIGGAQEETGRHDVSAHRLQPPHGLSHNDSSGRNANGLPLTGGEGRRCCRGTNEPSCTREHSNGRSVGRSVRQPAG